MSIKVNVSNWEQLDAATKRMRQEVFVGELGIPLELENDHLDSDSLHYSINNDKNDVLAIGRLTLRDSQAKISRLAVVPGKRRKGLGLYLGSLLVSEAHRRGAANIFLSTPVTMETFCKKLGFFKSGRNYSVKDTEHVEMVNFAPALLSTLEKKRLSEGPHFILGEDPKVYTYSNTNDLSLHTLAMVTQARKRIYSYSHSLEHAIYDNELLRDTLSHHLRTNTMMDVRLLVLEDRPIAQKRHQIAELYKRMPSLFEIRVINKQTHHEMDFVTLVDRDGIIYGINNLEYNGFANYYDPGQVRLKEDKFLQMWENATPSKEFRTIGI